MVSTENERMICFAFQKILTISFNFHPRTSGFLNFQISVWRQKIAEVSKSQIRRKVRPYISAVYGLCCSLLNIITVDSFLFVFHCCIFLIVLSEKFCNIALLFKNYTFCAVSVSESLIFSLIRRQPIDMNNFLFAAWRFLTS